MNIKKPIAMLTSLIALSSAFMQTTALAFYETPYEIIFDYKDENYPYASTSDEYFETDDAYYSKRISSYSTDSEGNRYNVVSYVTLISLKKNYEGRFEIPTEVDGMTVDYVEPSAFDFCNELTEVYIPASISEKMYSGLYFNYCSKLEKITLEKENELKLHLVDGVLFKGNTLLRFPPMLNKEEYTVPEHCTAIAPNAFDSTHYLDKLTIGECDINYSQFYASNCLAFSSVRVLDISRSAIADISSLTSSAYNIEDLYLPDTFVTNSAYTSSSNSIGNAVGGPYLLCTLPNLKNLYFNDTNPNFMSIDGCAYSKDGKTLICVPYGRKEYDMPEGCHAVVSGALNKIKKINFSESYDGVAPEVTTTIVTTATTTTMPYTDSYSKTTALPTTTKVVTSGGTTVETTTPYVLPFSVSAKRMEVNVPDDNTIYKDVDGIIYSKDMSQLIYCDSTYTSDTVIIPEGVEYINSNAFASNGKVTSYYIPKSIKYINPRSIGYAYDESYFEDKTQTNSEIYVTIYQNGYARQFWKSTAVPANIATPNENVVIYGYTGTYAQTYAEKNSFTFVALDNTDYPQQNTTSATTTTTTATTTEPTTSTTVTTTTPDIEASFGDITNDGIIDAGDASEILMLYAELSTSDESVTLDDAVLRIADLDGNGSVDAGDASLVLGYYAYSSTAEDGNVKTLKEFIENQE